MNVIIICPERTSMIDVRFACMFNIVLIRICYVVLVMMIYRRRKKINVFIQKHTHKEVIQILRA